MCLICVFGWCMCMHVWLDCCLIYMVIIFGLSEIVVVGVGLGLSAKTCVLYFVRNSRCLVALFEQRSSWIIIVLYEMLLVFTHVRIYRHFAFYLFLLAHQRYSVIAAAAHKMDVVLKVSQTVWLRNLHQRFETLNLWSRTFRWLFVLIEK